MKKTKIWVHTKCGGDIDIRNRRCLKCKKKWSITSFYITDTTGLRMINVKPDKPSSETKYAKWADKLPYVGVIASKLPNWPSWARIVSFIVFLVILVFVIDNLMRWIIG